MPVNAVAVIKGTQIRAAINATLSGDNVIVAGAANKEILIHQFAFTCAAPTTVRFEDEDGNVLAGPWDFDATGGAAPPFNPIGMFRVAAGKDLVLNVAGAVQVGGFIHGVYV